MNSTLEKLDETRVKLVINVPFVELQPHINQAYRTIAEKINVPGFRKGKVPQSIVDQKVGRAAVVDEAINSSLTSFYGNAVKEHDLVVMSRPSVEINEFVDNEKLIFSAEVDVRPEITLPDFSTVTVEVDDIELNDDEVNQQVDLLRERFGKLHPLENTPAKKGLFVSIDLVAKIDGQEIEGGTVNDISYEVGSNKMIDGLDDALEGMNVGESKSFESKLVGQTDEQKGDVTVTLKAVKERELPELNDDFAKLASEFETLLELRADVRSRVERVKKLEQAYAARDTLVNKLLSEQNIPIPNKMVEDEVNQHLASENREKDEEHRKEVTEQLTSQIKKEILLDTIVSAENISPTEEELSQYIYRASANYGMSPDNFIKQISDAGQISAMVSDVARAKALAAILSRTKVVTKSGQVVEIEALNQTAAE